jgi:hypothetical protein
LRKLGLLITSLTLLATSVRAHHGLDFVLLQDGTVPKPGSVMFFDNTEWSTFEGAGEWSTEPGIHLGVTPWLALGVTGSLIDEGNGWHYLSTTPYLNVPIFNSDQVPWLSVSVYAGYEVPDNVMRAQKAKASGPKSLSKQKAPAAATSASSIPSSVGSKKAVSKTMASGTKFTPGAKAVKHNTGGNVGGGGPDAPTGGTAHDHPVAPVSSAPSTPAATNTAEPTPVEAPVPVAVAPVEQSYLGIHRHGEEGLHARLIIDAELSHDDKIIANVINFTPRHGTPVWGYAMGYRHAFTHDFAMSLEAIGDFDGRGSHEALVAAHCTVFHALTLKLGVGMGLTENSPDASIHGGIVWRF